MDIDKLIEELERLDLLRKIQDKRFQTTEVPARLFLKMFMASLATRKSLNNCISTALETYTMRNSEKHLEEIKLQAANAGMEIEAYVACKLEEKIKKAK